ncbi:MAG TPA: DUF971 domain-containing protein [Halothiobacillus sp.]|nr:DUF971 domain-containing protein [Halothiobacillus sp.]
MNARSNIAGPREIRVHTAANALTCVWPDGRESRYTGKDLRDACRCAGCVSIASIGRLIDQDARAFVIASVEGVGGYGVQIIFQDGHDRGIYPWAYLRELAALDPDPEG